jgi:phage shock protein A
LENSVQEKRLSEEIQEADKLSGNLDLKDLVEFSKRIQSSFSENFDHFLRTFALHPRRMVCSKEEFLYFPSNMLSIYPLFLFWQSSETVDHVKDVREKFERIMKDFASQLLEKTSKLLATIKGQISQLEKERDDAAMKISITEREKSAVQKEKEKLREDLAEKEKSLKNAQSKIEESKTNFHVELQRVHSEHSTLRNHFLKFLELFSGVLKLENMDNWREHLVSVDENAFLIAFQTFREMLTRSLQEKIEENAKLKGEIKSLESAVESYREKLFKLEKSVQQLTRQGEKEKRRGG